MCSNKAATSRQNSSPASQEVADHCSPHGADCHPLDSGEFISFSRFLDASQEYARHSGCRFRSGSFSDIQEVTDVGVIETATAIPTAKRRAAPVVQEFSERVRGGDKELAADLNRALSMVLQESIRNAMIAAFREFDLWPPAPLPELVDEDDCSYEDLSLPIPVLAQHLYNDELKRKRDALEGRSGELGKEARRAMTASYLVDFWQEVNGTLPPTSEEIMATLGKFATRMREWREEASDSNEPAQSQSGFLYTLGAWSDINTWFSFGLSPPTTEVPPPTRGSPRLEVPYPLRCHRPLRCPCPLGCRPLRCLRPLKCYRTPRRLCSLGLSVLTILCGTSRARCLSALLLLLVFLWSAKRTK